jgi:hypothetical protein
MVGDPHQGGTYRVFRIVLIAGDRDRIADQPL